MRETIEIIVLILSALALGTLVLVFLELRKMIRKFDNFMEKTESAVLPTMEELQGTLRNVRSISGEVNGMTQDIRKVTTAVGLVSEEIEDLADTLKDVTLKTRASIEGIKAGFSTAVGVLKSGLFRKGDSSHD